VLTGASRPLIESDDDLYGDPSPSNKSSFLQHRTPPYIPSPPTPVTDLSLLDSPCFTKSPLLPSNFHLDHYGRSTSRAAVQRTNTNRPLDISLDSPPNSPPRRAKEDGFFTDMEGQPESSCDKGIEDVMKSLTVHSCKASGSALRGRSPATATHRSAGPSPSESSSHSASESRKQPRDVGAEVTKKLADASDSLLLHMQNKSESKVSSKRMKFEYARFSKELQAHEAYAEREHDARRFIATQSHERAMSEDKTRQLELELRLEEAKYRRLAMEHIGQVDTIGDEAN
jgi:hypothetical protein